MTTVPADAGRLYLDYAATTPVAPEVAARMAACLQIDGAFGNPSSLHPWGVDAARLVDAAAEQVAALIGGAPEGVVWTSGATESDNLAILGVGRFARERGRGNHVISARTEHAAVLGALEQLEREGMEVTLLPPGPDGAVSVDQVDAALRDDTVLVSLMHVNNETGAVNDIAAIGDRLRHHPARFHVDAAQSAGRLPLHVDQWGIDLLALSGHKLYGPKGVGALWVRRRPRVRLSPLLHGGGQQGGVRPGTLAPHLIAGMGAACALVQGEMAHEPDRLRGLRNRLRDQLVGLGAVQVNGQVDGSPHVLNVSIGCINGDALQADLGDLGVSAGSACSSSDQAASHVLRAMGVPDALAHSTLRFSFGRWTTPESVDVAGARVAAAAERLRALSPAWLRYRDGHSLDALYRRNAQPADASKEDE
ncbi:cysteine desulfurase family protein [Aquisalimonas asiatica]|uniref:cysteine desulfurase n=1 Tax=Aquisalimonas asiatica TaxID=406100 RepID=A0A1H8PN85_9GAMM|nr:aminotransferase class V-fold PLP-dependent enzyme [Aquisalimonas asiatica]SEO42983.1 cysteine desulfurase IscS [Aquisalimonas asiatica]